MACLITERVLDDLRDHHAPDRVARLMNRLCSDLLPCYASRADEDAKLKEWKVKRAGDVYVPDFAGRLAVSATELFGELLFLAVEHAARHNKGAKAITAKTRHYPT